MSVELANLEPFEEPFPVDLVVHEMLISVKTLEVDSDASFRSMTAYYSKAREWLDLIEQKRKEASGPARKVIALINDRGKQLSEPLEEVIAVANQKALEWQASRQADSNQTAELFEADKTIVVLKSDQAELVTRTQKCCRLLDISKVPLKYLCLDETAVLRDAKLGMANIPGVELYDEQTTTLRRK